MDVDIYPSSSSSFSPFPMTRSTSGKRARSPDTDTYFAGERPIKRIFRRSFGGTDGSRSPGGSSYGGGHSASSSRYPSEDWVAQAGGLSIDSPMFHPSRSSASSSFENLHQSDVDMAMDTEEQTLQPTTRNPSASSSSMSLAHSLSNDPGLPPSSSTLTSHNVIIQHPQQHPQINIHPATPTPSISSTRPSSRASIHSLHQQTPSPMALSPAQSFTQLLASTRKPKFTMGPRADCDKCRLGVKGHWMHL